MELMFLEKNLAEMKGNVKMKKEIMMMNKVVLQVL